MVVAESSLAEDVVSPQLIKLADIVITDDAFGTNEISLTGGDAAQLRAWSAPSCYLAAGTALDYETQERATTVTVSVAGQQCRWQHAGHGRLHACDH